MASGGARSRSGPPPDPSALRRDRSNDAAWTTLPAAGRVGDPPPWPMDAANGREATLWAELWAKPQAVEWERLGMGLEVALYVRRRAQAEERDAPVSLGTLLRQLGEDLGLTISGMHRHRWRIGPAVPAAAEAKTATVRARRASEPSARDRLTVIHGDQAG